MLLPLIKHLAAGGACSGGPPGQNECQVRNKPTLNCAAQQNGAGPLPPIRWHPVIGGSVTGTVIARLGNPVFGKSSRPSTWRIAPIRLRCLSLLRATVHGAGPLCVTSNICCIATVESSERANRDLSG
jgi:hypothetical protein